MKNKAISSIDARVGRRRMLGAIAAATSPAIVPAAALAAGTASPSRRSAGHSPAPGGGGLHDREGWLLARSDR